MLRVSFLLAAGLLLASIVHAQEGVVVERTGSGSVAFAPMSRRVAVTVAGRDATIRFEDWLEGCTYGSAVPTFTARVERGVIRVTRDGPTPVMTCGEPDRTCVGGDCPPPMCACQYTLTATVRALAPGRYRVVVGDGAKVQARGVILVR